MEYTWRRGLLTEMSEEVAMTESRRRLRPIFVAVVLVAVALGGFGAVLGAVVLTGGAEHLRPPLTSQPSSRVAVPNLAQQSGVAAAYTLREIGFKIKVIEEHTAASPINLVIATHPGAGVSLASGSMITLEVAAGP